MDELGTGAAVRCWARKWGLIRSDPPLCPHRDAIQEDGEGTWGPVCGKAMAEVKDVSFKNDGVVWHDRNPSFPPTSTSSSGGRETEAPTRTRSSASLSAQSPNGVPSDPRLFCCYPRLFCCYPRLFCCRLNSFASFAGHPLLSKEITVSRASAHKHAKLETLTLVFFDIDFRLLGTGPRSFSITHLFASPRRVRQRRVRRPLIRGPSERWSAPPPRPGSGRPLPPPPVPPGSD